MTMNISRIKEAAGIYVTRAALKILYLFPVDKKKIFFSSYEGMQFSCNPKYLYEYLREKQGSKLKYVYEYNRAELPEALKKDVAVVTHNSPRYFLEVMTSGVIVTNSGITAKIPLRKSQFHLNTWHGGGAYKKVGMDIASEMNGSGNLFIKISQAQTSAFLSSSRRFTEVMESAAGLMPEKFLPFGMPRNDMLLQGGNEKKCSLIRQKYGFSPEERLVLYAPTYRGKAGYRDASCENHLDGQMVLEALKKRFGGRWRLLYRGHYFQHTFAVKEDQTDVSDYPDMQELLALADVLITDYSSSIWDFSFTKKPGFLFVPDLESYKNERTFYTPVEQWPYKAAVTNEELCQIILDYDEAVQRERCRKHHEALGNYEKGTATEQTAELLMKQLLH